MGNSNAQYNVGVMSLYGKGAAQEDAKDLQWFAMAVAQGHAKAQYNLGEL